MKKTDLISLSYGIEAVLTKHRDSLSAKDIECLKEVQKTLREINVSSGLRDDGVLIKIVMQLVRFLMYPGMTEKISDFFHQINEHL